MINFHYIDEKKIISEKQYFLPKNVLKKLYAEGQRFLRQNFQVCAAIADSEEDVCLIKPKRNICSITVFKPLELGMF